MRQPLPVQLHPALMSEIHHHMRNINALMRDDRPPQDVARFVGHIQSYTVRGTMTYIIKKQAQPGNYAEAVASHF